MWLKAKCLSEKWKQEHSWLVLNISERRLLTFFDCGMWTGNSFNLIGNMTNSSTRKLYTDFVSERRRRLMINSSWRQSWTLLWFTTRFTIALTTNLRYLWIKFYLAARNSFCVYTPHSSLAFRDAAERKERRYNSPRRRSDCKRWWRQQETRSTHEHKYLLKAKNVCQFY